MKTTARLPFEKVRFDVPFRTHLVVTLDAPSVDWETKRQPVCVIPVIDVSGSMAGDKLDGRRSRSRSSSTTSRPATSAASSPSRPVSTVAAPIQMTAARKEAVRTAVEQLETTSQTNLAGGMLEGLRLANGSDFPDGMRVRVILFTDGCANVGIATTSEGLLPLLDANLGRATLSAFGYGADADQELLRDLSTRGKGNYAFVAGPDDAMTAFARELGGLLSTYAQDIVVDVRPVGGACITAVLSDVDADPRGSAVEIRIPDILADETRNVVVSVELPASTSRTTAPGTAFEVEVAWKVLAGGAHMADAGSRSSTRRSSVSSLGSEQVHPDRTVDVIVAQAELVRAQIEAEELARHGRHAGGPRAGLRPLPVGRGPRARGRGDGGAGGRRDHEGPGGVPGLDRLPVEHAQGHGPVVERDDGRRRRAGALGHGALEEDAGSGRHGRPLQGEGEEGSTCAEAEEGLDSGRAEGTRARRW